MAGHLFPEIHHLGSARPCDAGEAVRHGLDAVRHAETQRPDERVEIVAAHVAEGAGTILEEAAPFERMDIGAVIGVRGLGQPKFPIERVGSGLGGFRVGGHALRPDRAVRPDVDFLHGAHHPGVEPFLEQAVFLEGVALVAHLGDDALFRGGLVEFVGFPEGVHERFLDADVLAEGNGVHGRRVMGVIRGGDGHAVDALLFLQHFAEIAVLLRVGKFRGGLG